MTSLSLARMSKKIFATLIDYGIFMMSILVYMRCFGIENNGDYEIDRVMVLPIIIFWFIYFIVIEGIMQATLGHQLLGIKVVNDHYGEIDMIHSCKRRILDAIDFSFLGIPAIVTIRNTKLQQRIGDLLAKTIVVEEEK